MKDSKIRGLSHFTPTKSNDVTNGNKRLKLLRKLILYLKYNILNICTKLKDNERGLNSVDTGNVALS